MKLLIFGANGQIGRALNVLAEGDVIALGREEADFSKPETLPDIVAEINPAAIINAAAYTQVDKAEEEEALATIINGDAPGVLARVAAERKIPFVHYSTDYVFDGSGDTPWKEDDKTAPLNAYGRSKLAGEKAVTDVGGKFLIFRTSWVYDAYGKNFLNTMLRLGKDRETLKVVNDQIGAPSYAPHLAQATLQALNTAMEMSIFPSGMYHMSNAPHPNPLPVKTGRGDSASQVALPNPLSSAGGEGWGEGQNYISWYDFACAIFDEARTQGMELRVKDVLPIPSSEYPTPAKRPHNSRLDCGKLQSVLGITMPEWEAGLKEAITQASEAYPPGLEDSHGCAMRD